ncbi:bile acid:sodium symporter family protein [Methanolapillus ohkumae]|uniref:Bile acid:sodium symporter family protein n=1 Tax=Methanolapillus ohkumae TaxID=3028298 RepID=A0AA96V5L9_9EURY|nr:hypothetical protein MsAm2_08710 [Methanosarcinaceae archaeon Am2]
MIDQINAFLVSVQPYLLILFIYATMIEMGTTMTLQDISKSFKMPKVLLSALVINLVLSPLFAVAITQIFQTSLGEVYPAVALTAILINLIAGASGGPKNVQLAHGDEPMSIALLAVLSIAVVFIVPFTSHIFLPGDVQIDSISIIANLIVLVLIPMGLGLLLRGTKPAWADKLKKPLLVLSNLGLVGVILSYLVPNISNIIDVGLFVAFIFFLILLLNFLAGFLTLGNKLEKKTVSMVTIAKNFGVTLSLSATFFASYNLTPYLMTYIVIILIFALPVAILMRKYGGPGIQGTAGTNAGSPPGSK